MKTATYITLDYFKTPVWIIDIPDFLPHINKVSDGYIKKAFTLLI